MMYRIVLTMLFVAVAMGDEWIDPFSMDLDRPEELNALDSSQYHVTLAHYKRSLNLLLNALIFDERTDGYVGKITVDLSKADYDFVKEFAMGESPVTDFNKLDAILTQVYTRSIIDDLSDFYLSWSEYFLFVVTSQSFLMSLFVVLSSSIAYRIWKARLSLKEIMKCIFFVMWVIDFIYHYFKLVQQNEIEKMVNSMKFKSIPAECNPSELSTFSYVRTKMLGDKTCEEFMKAKYSDIYLNVNPLKILATQFGDFIKTPAPAIGESLGLMTSSFM
ncbi:PREDICTED: uncharacterized protein LOC108560359, partial [Nicrophorus vespilloides]|uniref:Chloride channel CLIC-like protein 1 n=1 Tax=Nicrophorus vespilloides TaxID=110193 RepID=A0ABM1MFL1_NICVS